jgi:DNA-binding winged helix-turn-helix (wHTH) protein
MPASPNPPRSYVFGDFVLEPLQQRLTHANQQPVALTPKAFDTLLCLVERSGDLVTKNELLARIWPNVVVEEAILARNVADLRKALGDDPNAPRYIETLPKRGYRFIARVSTYAGAAPQAGGTVDTLQLVAEQPALRATETLLDAPEFDRGGTGPRLFWLVIAVGLGLFAAAAWWLLN